MSDQGALPILLTRVDTSAAPEVCRTCGIRSLFGVIVYGRWHCVECGKALQHVLGRPVR